MHFFFSSFLFLVFSLSLSLYLSIYLSIYLSVYLSICLSIYLFIYLYFPSRKLQSLTRDTRSADYRLALFNRSSRIARGDRVAPHRVALHCTRAHVRIFKSRCTIFANLYDILLAREPRYYSSRKFNDCNVR